MNESPAPRGGRHLMAPPIGDADLDLSRNQEP